MSNDSITIPPETARHVLWMYGGDGGAEPGSFTTQLLRLIGYADHDNKTKLATLYPAEAQAVEMAQFDPDGMTTLQEIADGRGFPSTCTCTQPTGGGAA
ncbi:hypothetical protein [Streptomyces violascens]|uniref:hypothetical protein n=1 Tax=Streptomyces violascens TaxID=67381 RepID=UPI00368AD078